MSALKDVAIRVERQNWVGSCRSAFPLDPLRSGRAAYGWSTSRRTISVRKTGRSASRPLPPSSQIRQHPASGRGLLVRAAVWTDPWNGAWEKLLSVRACSAAGLGGIASHATFGDHALRRPWNVRIEDRQPLAIVLRGASTIRATRARSGPRQHARKALPWRGQAAGGQARLRAASPPVGGRALLCRGQVLPPPRQRLWALCQTPGRPAPRRLRPRHAQTVRSTRHRS